MGKEIPLYQNKSWLEEQYRKRGLSSREIANLIKVSGRTINHWLDRYEIRWIPEEDRLGKEFFNKYLNYRIATEKLNEAFKTKKTQQEVVYRNIKVWGIYYSKLERKAAYRHRRKKSKARIWGCVKLRKLRRLRLIKNLGGKCFICNYKTRKKSKLVFHNKNFIVRERGAGGLQTVIDVEQNNKEFILLCYPCSKAVWRMNQQMGFTWKEIERRVKKYQKSKEFKNFKQIEFEMKREKIA